MGEGHGETEDGFHTVLVRSTCLRRKERCECSHDLDSMRGHILIVFQAEMELALIVATVFRRYEFELYQDNLETREGFLRKPLGLQVGMRKRESKS